MDWVSDGKKFALLGLNMNIEHDAKPQLPPNYGILQQQFDMPPNWKEWMGTERIGEIEACPAFLYVTMPSSNIDVLDGENQKLRSMIGHWFTGLLLSGKFVAMDDPFVIGGSHSRGELDVREFATLMPVGRGIVETMPNITAYDLEQALTIGEGLAAIVERKNAEHWRLRRCIAIYQQGRSERDILNRLHQFVRCIDGLIVSEQGKGERQFKSRTKLFIGPAHEELMGNIYRMRSAIEHLHEHRHLETYDRATRIEIARMEAISELIARSCLSRILLDQTLRSHFGHVDTATTFWKLPDSQQADLWGSPIDPLSALAGFDLDWVSDRDLGREY